MARKISDSVVVITGATSGIGRATALRLAIGLLLVGGPKQRQLPGVGRTGTLARPRTITGRLKALAG